MNVFGMGKRKEKHLVNEADTKTRKTSILYSRCALSYTKKIFEIMNG